MPNDEGAQIKFVNRFRAQPYVTFHDNETHRPLRVTAIAVLWLVVGLVWGFVAGMLYQMTFGGLT